MEMRVVGNSNILCQTVFNFILVSVQSASKSLDFTISKHQHEHSGETF